MGGVCVRERRETVCERECVCVCVCVVLRARESVWEVCVCVW